MNEREPIQDGRPENKPADEPKDEGFGLKNFFDLMNK